MLQRLRDRAEAFLAGAARERCRNEREECPQARLNASYAQAEQLFGREPLLEVQRELSEATGEEEKRLRFLREFLVMGSARGAAADELDRMIAWSTCAVVQVEGRRVPLRAVRSVLRATADRALRGALAEVQLSALEEQAPLVVEALAREREAVEELGYGSFVASYEVLRGVDLQGLAQDAERFLADTDAPFRELIAWYLPRLAGVEPGEARAADAARLEWAAPFAGYFSDARLFGRMRATLDGIGVDPDAGGRLRTVTGAELPSPDGIVCCPIRVPDEILLTLTDHPGRPAAAALLNGLGRALHLAYAAPDLPLEYRRLGDPSVTLAYGRLLERLLGNRPFSERVCEIPRSSLSDHLRLGALLDLLHARRQIGLLLFHLASLSEPDTRGAGERYTGIMERAIGLRHDSREALWALRSPFRPVPVLGALQLGAVLSHHMRDRYDEDWWRNPRSGAHLIELFRSGRSYTAAEMSMRIDSAPLSFERFRWSVEERL